MKSNANEIKDQLDLLKEYKEDTKALIYFLLEKLEEKNKIIYELKKGQNI